jgi:Tfp pilus assembly protein PilN
MSEGINLLEPTQKSSGDIFLKRIQTTRFIMVGLLFVVSVTSVILFILVALSPLPALQKQEQSLRQTLAKSKSDIVKYELVNERVVAISGIMKQRIFPDQTLTQIQSILPGDTQITTIKEDSKTVTLSVESASLQSLDSFINGLIGFVQDKKVFSNVTLTNLTTDETDNEYSITVTMNIL